jgi:hypothetical protein
MRGLLVPMALMLTSWRSCLSASSLTSSTRQVRLPLETLAQHKVSQAAVLRGEAGAGLTDTVHQLASMAHSHLQTGMRVDVLACVCVLLFIHL